MSQCNEYPQQMFPWRNIKEYFSSYLSYLEICKCLNFIDNVFSYGSLLIGKRTSTSYQVERD